MTYSQSKRQAITRSLLPTRASGAAFAAFLLAFTMGSDVRAANVTLANQGMDNRLASITGLDIAGQTYNVTFHTGTIWILYKSVPATPITFTTSQAATEAATAVRQAVVQSGFSGLGTPRSDDGFIPYADNGIHADVVWISTDDDGDGGANPDYTSYGQGGLFTYSSQSVSIEGKDQWLEFTPVTSVPMVSASGVIMLVLSLAGVACWRVKKRLAVGHA